MRAKMVPRDLAALQPTPLEIRVLVLIREFLRSVPARSVTSALAGIRTFATQPTALFIVRIMASSADRQASAQPLMHGDPTVGSAQAGASATESGSYVTATGLRVRDCRKRSAHAPSNQCEAAAKDDFDLPAPPSTRRRNARTGGILKRVCPELPDELGAATLGELFKSSAALRAIAADRPSAQVTIEDALSLANDPRADFRALARRWIGRHKTKVEIGQAVVDGLVGGPRQTGNQPNSALLHLVPAAAGVLSDGDSEKILNKLFELVRGPVDPYEGSGPQMLAREAALALLQTRPELTQGVIEALKTHASHGSPAPDATPDEAQLVAIAVRSQGNKGLEIIADLAQAIGGQELQLRKLASLADGRPHREPAAPALESRKAASVGRGTRLALPWLAPPSACVMVLLLWKHHPHLYWHGHRLPVSLATLGLPEAIAALALLATVHVFAVQLSAARLPGAIARYSGRSWSLSASYSASLTMLFIASLRLPDEPATGVEASLSLALAIFVTCLVAALWTVLSRTDPARAAAAFVDSRSHRIREAGKRLGRFQGLSAELRNAIEDTPRLEIKTDAILDDWQTPIYARRRGFLMPSRQALFRLMTDDPFRDGMRLRLRTGVGTVVSSGTDIAHIVPTVDQSVDQRLVRRARRTLVIKDGSDIEEVSSWAVALLGLAIELGTANDFGTAAQVLQSLVRLSSEHVISAARARRSILHQWELRERIISQRATQAGQEGFDDASRHTRASSAADDHDLAPVIPLIRHLVLATLKAELNSDRAQLELVDQVVEPVLRMGGEAESAIGIITHAVPKEFESESQLLRTCMILRAAALRALELRARTQFNMLLIRMDEIEALNGKETSRIRDTMSEIAAIACRFDVAMTQNTVARLVANYHRLDDTKKFEEGYSLWRVGAAAMSNGTASVAVDVAVEIADRQLGHIITGLGAAEDRLVWEASRADIFGGYLGDRPRESLSAFARFCESVLPMLERPEPAGSSESAGV